MIRRREFITLLGGAAAGWPLVARAQQGERMRRIGVLDVGTESVPGTRAGWDAFREALVKLGWTEGRNLWIESRSAEGNPERLASSAAELVRLSPDLLVTAGGAATQAVKKLTQTIPIIFAAGGDATANGLVKNIARPEGNVTGFSVRESSVAGKWLGLLKEAAPHDARAADIFNPYTGVVLPSYIASI